MSKDTYEAIANGENSADAGITFQADSPADAREQGNKMLAELGLDATVEAVIDENTGVKTEFD